MRNILSQVPRKSQGMASALVKTIFAQENRQATLRLVGPWLQGIDEDWMVGNRAMSKSSIMKLRPPSEVNELTAESLLLK